MIASTCAKEYFGIDIAKKVCNLFAFLSKVGVKKYFEEIINRYWKQSVPFNKEIFCKLCYGIITRDGHYIKGGGTTSEANNYMSLTFNEVNESTKFELNKILKLADKFDYNKMVEYWKSKKDQDNFTHNVCVAFGMYQPQHGYLAWAVFDYMKNVEGFGKPVQMTNSQHIGNIGEKINAEVKINEIRGMMTSWGYTNLVEMIDREGNILNWWTSKILDFDKGSWVKVVGNVKDHGEFRGVKNTVLKNCKMEIINV